jgi:hypothetical protein
MAITLDGTAGTTTPALTNSALTSGRVTYAGTSGVLQDSANLTFNGGSLLLSGDTTVASTISVRGSTAVTKGAGFQCYFSGSSYGGVYWDASGDSMRFESKVNTEMMRLDTNSSLLIGYTATNGSTYKLQVNSQIFATSATIATSDARYKKDITPITGGLDLVNKLNPVLFNWKSHPVHDFDTVNTDVGFIAQEVQSALAGNPYLSNVVKSNQTELPDGTKEEFLGIADGKLIPILVKAIQELTARVTALEAK